MSTILAIETATPACSVALMCKGEIIERFEIGNNIHSMQLLSMVDEVLNQSSTSLNQLDAIAAGQGPGSFTGLRIGVGVAQGLAYASGLPMIAVCSLEALAYQFDVERVLAGLDARMSEIYWASFYCTNGELSKASDIAVSAPEQVSVPDKDKWLAVGTAWSEYEAKLSEELKKQLVIEKPISYPRASAMLKLAEQKLKEGVLTDAQDFKPVYIRDKVAKKKGE